MLECVDEGDRARCALTILLQSLDSFAGYLFGISEDRHTLLASLPEQDVPDDVMRWFKTYLAQEIAADEPPAAKSGKSNRRAVSFRFVDGRGQAFEPLFLTKPEGPNQKLAAVLVFHANSDTRRRPSRELQQELAEQLLEHGDVIGITLEATGTQTRTR
jgi:hypothetical protein